MRYDSYLNIKYTLDEFFSKYPPIIKKPKRNRVVKAKKMPKKDTMSKKMLWDLLFLSPLIIFLLIAYDENVALIITMIQIYCSRIEWQIQRSRPIKKHYRKARS